MKIHTGDEIIVIAGKDKGKKAKVVQANPKTGTVTVEGVNRVTRHMKRQGSTPGQKVTYEKPIHVSNVMIVDPKTGKPSRVGYRIENGKKVRFAKQSGTAL